MIRRMILKHDGEHVGEIAIDVVPVKGDLLIVGGTRYRIEEREIQTDTHTPPRDLSILHVVPIHTVEEDDGIEA